MIELIGKYANAKIMIDDVESECIGQIIKMINNPAFDNYVAIMPDTHLGKGSVIGFTMKTGDKIIPNVIGVDISCGVLSFNVGQIKMNHQEIDELIRKRIPFGMEVRPTPAINFERDVKWDDWKSSFPSFKKLCSRIGSKPFYVQQSIGTLGGGNHYIEIGISQNTIDRWITIHSGSRNLGKKICEYWQDVASIKKFEENHGNYKDVVDKIKKSYPKNEWQHWIAKYKFELKIFKKSELDYLENENKNLYLEDMLFAQKYASLNRQTMKNDILKILHNPTVHDEIETIHNFIDLKDNIIRKGAIRSYIGEKMVIPFNMRDGMLICEGKSNHEWNFSAPHGAGRIYSRRKAKEELNINKFKSEMVGIFSTSINESTLDESPMAYKDSKIIEDSLEPTAIIIDRVIPIHNLKAGKINKEQLCQ